MRYRTSRKDRKDKKPRLGTKRIEGSGREAGKETMRVKSRT